jgi:hypothetical protein
MDNLIFFFKIIAWVIGVVSTLLGTIIFCLGIIYSGSAEELLDNVRGYTKVFRSLRFFIIALICWAFIIAF